ncbi:HAD family hydrolase [bacterium]|nr:HAD family hydrolase [bacterium]
MKLCGVIFDMDGTITAPYLDFLALRARAGIPATRDVLEYIGEAQGADAERLHALLREFEDDGAANARLNPGARGLLAGLAKRGVPTALLTRNSRRSVDAVCTRLELRFDVTVTREDGPHKPAPDAIWQIARRWHVAPADVLVVGDYKWDLHCARNAGAPSALLVNGSGRPDWAGDADYIIRRLTEVLAIVDGRVSPVRSAG